MRLLGCVHVSNVLGTVNPVAKICARARSAGAVTLVDGSQAVPQMPVDVGEIGCDFYIWTGHKALGPTGIGVLHGRRELLEDMPPFLGGGDMISFVGYEVSTWNDLPIWKFDRARRLVAVGYLADRRGRRGSARRDPTTSRRDLRHGAGARARALAPAGMRSSGLGGLGEACA